VVRLLRRREKFTEPDFGGWRIRADGFRRHVCAPQDRQGADMQKDGTSAPPAS
jgi:hypothetical protein